MRSQSMDEVRIDLGDSLVFHRVPVHSETAIVAFSARPIEPGRFHFFSLAQLFPESSKLLVRDPGRSWYNAGLPGVGDTVEEIAAWLREQVAALGAERVIATGPSMGGYAAILFGCMIGAERAIAIAPQTLLDPGLRWMAPPENLELQAPDLEPIIRNAPETKVDIVFASNHLLDAFHAQRVAGAPSVRTLSRPGGHDLARELNEQGELWPLIGKLIEDGTPSNYEVDPEFAPDLLQPLREAIAAAARADWEAAADAIAPIAERYPDWSAPRVALAEALSQRTER